MKKTRLILVLLSVLMALPASAQELRRKLNTATRVQVRFINSSTGALITSASSTACKCKTWNDGASPADFTTACGTASPTEIGSSGIYYLPLTQGETNDTYFSVLCTSTSTNAMPWVVTGNTKYGTVLTDSAGALEDLGSTANTDVQNDVDAKLNAAIGGSPTTGSIYERLKKLTDPSGSFQTGSTTTDLVLASGETSNDISGGVLLVETGTAARDFCKITAYNTSTKHVTCAPALTNAPASGDGYTIVADADINPTSVENAVWNAARSGHTSAGTFGEGVIVNTNNDKTNTGLSSATIQAIWDAATTNFNASGSIGKKLKDWTLGADNKVLLSTSAQTGVTIPTVTAITNSVTVGTNNDKSGYSISGSKQTLDSLNDITTSQVNTQVANALSTYGTATNSNVNSQLTTIKGAGFNASTDTLEELADAIADIPSGGGGGGGGGGDCANVDEIAEAVWDEILTSHSTANSAGKLLKDSLNITLECNTEH